MIVIAFDCLLFSSGFVIIKSFKMSTVALIFDMLETMRWSYFVEKKSHSLKLTP